MRLTMLVPVILALVPPPVPRNPPITGSPSGCLAVVADRNQRPGVFVVESDGEGCRRLTDGEMDLSPTWSPDGKRLAFLSLRQADLGLAARYRLSFHWWLYAVDADGKRFRRLTDTPMSQFLWSPDGRRILFTSSYEDKKNYGKDGVVSAALYVMDVEGRGQKRLTPVGESCLLGSWSPDGKHLAFSSNRDGNSDIYILGADGQGLRRLTHTAAYEQCPLWSPDGKRIVFTSARGEMRTNEVYVVNADGTGKKRLTAGSAWVTPFGWSPEGGRILFASGDALEVMDHNGGNQSRLTPAGERVVEAAFASDGQAVFYRAVRGGTSALFRVDLKGGDPRKVAAKLGGVSGFSLWPGPQR